YQPTLYAQYLTDGHGHALTEQQVSRILDLMESYTKTHQSGSAALAERVDKAINPRGEIEWDNGERRYLPSKRAPKKILEFVQYARAQLPRDPGARRQRRPFAEFGYTNNAKKRLGDHSSHRGSTYIMNLIEAVCAAHYDQYRMRQFVVYKIWHVQQASIGEALLSRIGAGYISSGYGLNHTPAGLSNQSAKKLEANNWEPYNDHA
ncbi:hypothetical protein IWX90DRAFT_358154, partial [Phyllosticta citrichinensis]